MFTFKKIEDEECREFVGDIVIELVKQMREHPFVINKGRCEEFASELQEVLGDDAEILTFDDVDPNDRTVGHYFVKYKQRYYDAEEPFGVKDYKHLPIWQRSLREWD